MRQQPRAHKSQGIPGKKPPRFPSLLRWLSALPAVFIALAAGCSSATCKEDAQCGAQETCQAGQCVKKEPQTNTCNKDADCKADEACNTGKCGPPPADCKANTDCKTDEICRASKCAKAECTKDADCAGKTKPYCSTARACEWECKEDSHCPTGARCTSNRCSTDALACQSDTDCADKERKYCSDQQRCEWQCKQDAHCTMAARCDPQTHACKTRQEVVCKSNAACKDDELCFAYRCWKRCEQKKDDCAQGQICHVFTVDEGDMVYIRPICVTPCDPKQSACTDGLVCQAHTPCLTVPCHGGDIAPREPLCLPAGLGLRPGTKQRGEKCTPKATTIDDDCDGHKGLFCEPTGQTCLPVCIPGKQENCPKDDECITAQGQGGLCVPLATQKAGEACDAVYKRCLTGLTCNAQGTCQADKQEGSPCSQSTDCPEGLTCHGKLCRKTCHPSQGIDANPACAQGQHCDWRSTTGLCAWPRKVGEACDDNIDVCTTGLVCQNNRCVALSFAAEGKPCDFSTTPCQPGLDCRSTDGSGAFLRCWRICDHHQGQTNNPTCSSSQECLLFERPNHALCITKQKTQPLDAVCNAMNLRCLDGLFCDLTNNRCIQGCDPAQGRINNPKCALGSYCKADDFPTQKGQCLKLPPFLQGPKEAGEPCLSAKDTPQNCNDSKALFCKSEGQKSTCQKACDPQKTDGCTSSEECIEDTSSPTGGACLPKRTRTTGQNCDTTQRCLAGLICYDGACHTTCDSRDGTQNNPTCATTQHCISVSVNAQSYGVCITPTQQEGAACSSLSLCKAGLRCYQRLCLKECDHSKGSTNNPLCQTSRACQNLPSWNAREKARAFCLPKGTQTLGQTCNTFTNPCLGADLQCWNKRCVKKTRGELAHCTHESLCQPNLRCITLSSGMGLCMHPCDPQQGKENNPSCNNTQLCHATKTSPSGGLCTPK